MGGLAGVQHFQIVLSGTREIIRKKLLPWHVWDCEAYARFVEEKFPAKPLLITEAPLYSETHGRDQVHRIMVKQKGAIFSKTMLRRMCFEVVRNFAMIFCSLLPQLFG